MDHPGTPFGPRARRGETACARGRCGQWSIVYRPSIYNDRIIQRIGLALRLLVPRSCVRIETVLELVFAEIRCRVGHGGGAQKRDAHHIVMDVMSVLAVVQETDAIVAFAQV